MSEPRGQGEIADVLSSIRRLVTEEPPAPPAPAEGGKLILTPALRVVEEAGGRTAVTGPARPDAPEVQAVADAGAAAADAPVIAPAIVASIGAATDRDAAAWESETGDAWSADRDGRGVAALVRQAVADISPRAGNPFAGPPGEAAAVPAAQDNDTAQGAGEAVRTDSGPSAPAAAEVPSGAVPDPEAAAAADPGDPFALSWRPAAPQPVPDGDAALPPVPSGPAAGAPVAADQPPPGSFVAGDAPLGPASATAEDPLDALIAEDDGPLDEEALRDLVRELIRDELQGPLGERITRNLRKLVRAEVQRALAARTLQ